MSVDAGLYVRRDGAWLRMGQGEPEPPPPPPAAPGSSFVLGTTMPDAATTRRAEGNVTDGTVGLLGADISGYRVHQGNLTLNDTQTVERLIVTGVVNVRAGFCRLRKLLILGGPPPNPSRQADNFRGTDHILLNIASGASNNTVVEDCEIIASHPTVDTYGINGGQATVRRTIIRGVVDGWLKHRGNAIDEGLLIDDIRRYAWDPRHSDGSHSDGIQHQGGSGRSTGTRIRSPREGTSGCLVTQDAALVDGLIFEDGWYDGGNSPLYIYDKSGDPNRNRPAIKNLAVRGMRFGPTARSGLLFRVEAPTYDLNVQNFVRNVHAVTGADAPASRGVSY